MKSKIIITIVVLFITTQSLYAQNTLSGKITDKNSKQALPYTTISIVDLHATVLADSLGNYHFTSVPSASYEIQISALSYKAFSKIISINGTSIYNFELDKSSTELAEVVVTGSSKATQIKKSPLPIVSINKEYLTSNLSTNVIDAIAKIPGVSSVTTGPNVSKPFIRGLGFNRILTLYDGMRQEGQQWGDEHGIEMDNYAINKIEIIKGPASLMYGSDALAGVINLIPSQPLNINKISGAVITEHQTNNGMFGGSVFLTGNKNGFEYGGRISTRIAKNYQNSVDGKVYGTGFNETAANAFIGLHKKWGYSHLSISLYDNLQEIPDGSRDSTTRKFTKQITEADTLRPIVSNDELNVYTINVLHQRVQHNRFFFKNSFFFANSRLDANIGYQRSVRREYSHPQAPYQEVAGLYLKLNTFNYDVKYFLPEFNEWAIVVGANGMYQTNDVTAGTSYVIPSYNQFDFGAFATLKKEFGKLNIAGGLRYDIRNFNSKELFTKPNATSGFDQSVTGADTMGADKPFKNYSTIFKGFTGSLGFSYAINNYWALKVNLSRGYRAPNISEISANGVHPGTGFYQIGNDQFKSEFSNQADIGASFISKSVSASASLFINQIDNYIYNTRLQSSMGGDSLSNSSGQNYPTYKFQQGKVLLYGLEANIDFHIIKRLHFDHTISLIYGDNKSFTGAEKTNETKYVPTMPPFRYITELKYELAEKSKTFDHPFVKLQVQYTATQNRVFTYDNTETPTQGYTLVNLGAGTGIKNRAGNTRLNVYILANNIFDLAYQEHLSRLKYFEQYSSSPNGRLGIYNMGRNISLKVILPF